MRRNKRSGWAGTRTRAARVGAAQNFDLARLGERADAHGDARGTAAVADAVDVVSDAPIAGTLLLPGETTRAPLPAVAHVFNVSSNARFAMNAGEMPPPKRAAAFAFWVAVPPCGAPWPVA